MTIGREKYGNDLYQIKQYKQKQYDILCHNLVLFIIIIFYYIIYLTFCCDPQYNTVLGVLILKKLITTMIYITAHKPFNCPEFVNDSNYTIITDGTDIGLHYPAKVITANNELEPMKYTYSEGFQIYDIWKTQPDYEWIGINHYRRYFQPDDVFNHINILPKPMQFNVQRQYAACHNIEDYNEMIGIVNEYYPEMNTNLPDLFFPCNCCILEHEVFKKWCDFSFNCTFIYNERHHLYTDDDVAHFVNSKSKNGVYQNRLHGFLLERLSTIFFLNYFKDKPTELRCKDLIMYDVPALQPNVK